MPDQPRRTARAQHGLVAPDIAQTARDQDESAVRERIGGREPGGIHRDLFNVRGGQRGEFLCRDEMLRLEVQTCSDALGGDQARAQRPELHGLRQYDEDGYEGLSTPGGGKRVCAGGAGCHGLGGRWVCVVGGG